MKTRKTSVKFCLPHALVLFGLAFASSLVCASESEPPQRLVSLNVCTDQLLMLLAPFERIVAVSHLARDADSSAMSAEAQQFPITFGSAEEVFLLEPDLVLAGEYTTRETVLLLRRLGIPVLEVGIAANTQDIAENLLKIGDAIGMQQRARALVHEFQQGIAGLHQGRAPPDPEAGLLYPNRYSSGPATLAENILEHGGFQNMGRRAGVKGTARISLETLIFNPPDALILGRATDTPNDLAHEVYKHPALAQLAAVTPNMDMHNPLWSCGTPHSLGAMRRVRALRKRLDGDWAQGIAQQ